MLGEVIRVLAVAGDEGRDYYPTTLFAQAEAMNGACTARGVIYAAAIAAGLMTGQFTRWLRGLRTKIGEWCPSMAFICRYSG
jgi:hypothetical protein